MRTSRHGQAAYEFALASFVFAVVVSILVSYVPVLLQNLDMLDDARTDAGISALNGTQGSRPAGRAGAARIAAAALPDRSWTALGGQDPWDYPVRKLPREVRFEDWRTGTPSAPGLCYGVAKDRFTVSSGFDGDGRIVEEDVDLSEEVFIPALGQSQAGGAL